MEALGWPTRDQVEFGGKEKEEEDVAVGRGSMRQLKLCGAWLMVSERWNGDG